MLAVVRQHYRAAIFYILPQLVRPSQPLGLTYPSHTAALGAFPHLFSSSFCTSYSSSSCVLHPMTNWYSHYILQWVIVYWMSRIVCPSIVSMSHPAPHDNEMTLPSYSAMSSRILLNIWKLHTSWKYSLVSYFDNNNGWWISAWYILKILKIEMTRRLNECLLGCGTEAHK